jgi:hypothetical protein
LARGGQTTHSALIGHADTNALIRLSQNAIPMARIEAERIISRVSDTFGVDRSKFEKRIYPEKLFDYDLGMWTVRYRTKGADPIDGMNYPLRFSLRATSPTTAVLVMYGDIR